jgi:hypothetical protein
MKLLSLILATFVLPAAVAGVAQARFLAATEATRQIVIRLVEPAEKNRASLLDSSDPKVVAQVKRLIVLEDPKRKFDERGEEIWTLPSFCCAKYSLEFISSDGSSLVYFIKQEVTSILPPDPHGLHDLTDIQLSKKSQRKLRSFLAGLLKKKKEPNQELEPTTTAVTNRAGARFAPAVVVAHL